MRFSKIYIEISNICNLQCSFCPEVLRTKGLMGVEQFTHIIKQVGPLTDQVCFHLMGDPLLHPQLPKFVDLCSEYGVKIFLVTNGVLLREKQAELLLHPAFRQVNFSLHSFHDNFGAKDPSIYLERIFAFTEKAFVLRQDLYINYRLWNLADPKGSDVKNLGMLKRIGDRFGVAVDGDVNVKKHKSRPIKNRLYLHFDTEFTWPSLDLPILGERGRCYGLSTQFGILVDGTVVPCCLDKEGKIPLGNINNEPIVDILQNEKSKKILQGFRSGFLTEDLCQRCQYITRFSKSPPVKRINHASNLRDFALSE